MQMNSAVLVLLGLYCEASFVINFTTAAECTKPKYCRGAHTFFLSALFGRKWITYENELPQVNFHG